MVRPRAREGRSIGRSTAETPRWIELLRPLTHGGYPEHMSSDSEVNYDSAPVAETELDGIDYRIDAGKQGTALCISSRASGTWDWTFESEARWDGSSLRARSLERPVLVKLSEALREAMQDV
jgi:hypothetical protein